MRVKRRHIIYVQGYDPRGLAQYYRMFRSELRKFAALYGLTCKVGRPAADDARAASWTIDTQGPDWQTRTRYDFLRWEDLIKADLEWPIWRTVTQALGIYIRLIFNGVLTRFRKAHWRFAAFISYPEFVLTMEALLSLGAATLFAAGLRFAGLPLLITLPAAAALFIALLGTLLKLLESRTYTLYLMSDTIFTWQYAHRQRPDWDQRIEQFARDLVATVRSSDADEIVVVGHSSGSFLGLEILMRALELDPEIGRRGPRLMLLTIGGNLPIVGFLPVSDGFRARLKRLAAEPSIHWVDCQSRKDVMNFYPFDPIAGHGIDVGAARRNPKIVNVRFRDIIAPENYNAFRRHFFRVHFQFVMANEQPNAYDFFMMVCGPLTLCDRFAHPATALAIATGDPATRDQAWSELEEPPIGVA
ncbi:alpha/beta fold hydrolase [Bradyrhizobium sp. 2TAF24]|uniref:alpha/beta fold hydrolase n=1 Tax=Bradyrhizobium sp. 2TAF24 TaxID=3233011 RepID=UPI003F8FE204